MGSRTSELVELVSDSVKVKLPCEIFALPSNWLEPKLAPAEDAVLPEIEEGSELEKLLYHFFSQERISAHLLKKLFDPNTEQLIFETQEFGACSVIHVAPALTRRWCWSSGERRPSLASPVFRESQLW
jgi:hypothetical protein